MPLPQAALESTLQTQPARQGANQKPRKILMLYQDFGVMGGIERYLLQTLELLAQQTEFQPLLACSQGGPLFKQAQLLGIPVYGLPNRTFFAKSFLRSLDVFSWVEILRILKREKPDLLHVHMGLQENSWLRKLGFPVAYTFHGYGTLFSMADVHNPVKLAFKRLTRRWFRQTASEMDALLVVSHAERNRLMQEGYLSSERQSEVLHNGMPVGAWRHNVQTMDRQTLRREWSIPEGSSCVTFFNRLDFNKNPLHFIALAKQLTRRAEQTGLPAPYFLMAGGGPMEGQVRQESDALPNFRYLGLCKNIPALLAATDLVIHPASREGFGLGVVEAMAAGVPVLAYDCGGPQEILNTPETQHLLVPVNDIDGLEQKAAALLATSSEEKAALQAKLYKRAQDFDIERFIIGLTQVYQRLIPKVSVILPVFNGEATVIRAVSSVLSQTHANLELIVVDDGSTDSTLAQLASVQDERLRVLSQSNQGVAHSRNFAFEQSTGEWIGFIDADDVWLPEKLFEELSTARRTSRALNSADSPDRSGSAPCLVYSGYFAVNEQDQLIHQPPIPQFQGDLSQESIEHEGLFLPSTSLVHRAVYETVGGFRTDCYHEDRVFFIEACRHFPAFSSGKRLVLYQQSLTGRCRRVLKDYDLALQAELSIVETLRPLLSQPELRRLEALQRRNLIYRFLMYNYLSHARRLFQESQYQSNSDPAELIHLFQGNKGRLAKLSLRCRINFMFAARLFIQGFTQNLVSPIWSLRIKSLLILSSPKKPPSL